MSAENEDIAAEIQIDNADPVAFARTKADELTNMIKGLDEADKIIEDGMREEVEKIEAAYRARLDKNAKRRARAKVRRDQLRKMANELEAERDA